MSECGGRVDVGRADCTMGGFPQLKIPSVHEPKAMLAIRILVQTPCRRTAELALPPRACEHRP